MSSQPPGGSTLAATGPDVGRRFDPAHAGRRRPVETGLSIDADGGWHHNGRPILRPALVRLFARHLVSGADGATWLVTPAEYGRVQVADVPFVAVELVADGPLTNSILTFRTNVDDWVTAGPDHPLRIAIDPRTGTPRPYILVRYRLEARLTRPVYYELIERGIPQPNEHGEEIVGVWSKQQFFPLGGLS